MRNVAEMFHSRGTSSSRTAAASQSPGGEPSTTTLQETPAAQAEKSPGAAGNEPGEYSASGSAPSDAGTSMARSVPTTYDEMFKFNAAVMGFGHATWMAQVQSCFDRIVINAANSGRLQEECSILALRISRCTDGTVKLSDYKACMLASLSSLLPKEWGLAHEAAWTWLWDQVERMVGQTLDKLPVWEKALAKLFGELDESALHKVRSDIFASFFAAAPVGQDYFKQSNARLHFIAERLLDMTLELYKDPIKLVDELSALGLRHVGYGIPVELFAPFESACLDVLAGVVEEEVEIEAFSWSLRLISRILTRTITEGSTLVMKAVVADSARMIRTSLDSAPRSERASWMLVVQVGTECISPLEWAMDRGCVEAVDAIIADLLTIRADREKYYFGADELWGRHFDILKRLLVGAPNVVPTLLNGLVWRSHLTHNGWRRVNYYLEHLIISRGGFSKTIQRLATSGDPRLISHPVAVLTQEIIWTGIARFTFVREKIFFLLSLLIFVGCWSVADNLDEERSRDLTRIAMFTGKAFVYICCLPLILLRHAFKCCHDCRSGAIGKWLGIRGPLYLRDSQEFRTLLLAFVLIATLSLEPLLWCWRHRSRILFAQRCEEHAPLRRAYNISSELLMAIYILIIFDLVALTMPVLAFLLVCWRMLIEAALCFCALAAMILTFSSAISVMKHDVVDFQGVFIGVSTLLKASLGLHAKERMGALHREPIVLALLLIFMVLSIIFILNVFVAQLTCQYSALHAEMRGLALLHRAGIIVQTMPKVSTHRWERFKASLHFDERLEFNEGDIGLPGGIQILEPASAHPTTVDRIVRYGGSTSPTLPWPADDQAGRDDAKGFERLEKLMRRTLERAERVHGQDPKQSEVLSVSRVRMALQHDDDSSDADSEELTPPLQKKVTVQAMPRRVTRFETGETKAEVPRRLTKFNFVADPFAEDDPSFPSTTKYRQSQYGSNNSGAGGFEFSDSDEFERSSNESMDSLLNFISRAPQSEEAEPARRSRSLR